MFRRRLCFARDRAADHASLASTPGYCTKPKLFPAHLPKPESSEADRWRCWGSQHERSARLGAAEDQQFGGPHFHSNFFGLSTVIDEGKQRDASGLQDVLEVLHRLVDSVTAGFVDDSPGCCGSHELLLKVLITILGTKIRRIAHGN